MWLASTERLVAMNISRPAGFTLIELITCMVILGILIAVVAPRFPDNQIFSTRGFADELASSLRHAQRIAIASDCSVQVRIDAAGYSAWQRSAHATCNSPGAWDQAVPRTDGTALEGVTPDGVAGAPATTVIFLRGGELDGGANVALAVGAYTINVSGRTGRVSVQ